MAKKVKCIDASQSQGCLHKDKIYTIEKEIVDPAALKMYVLSGISGYGMKNGFFAYRFIPACPCNIKNCMTKGHK